VIMEIFEISCKYFSTACESRLVICVAILSCLIMGINKKWTISFSGMNQRYNKAKGGKVDKGKINYIPQCTGTKVTPKRGTS
jgi:hypothetical protein